MLYMLIDKLARHYRDILSQYPERFKKKRFFLNIKKININQHKSTLRKQIYYYTILKLK